MNSIILYCPLQAAATAENVHYAASPMGRDFGQSRLRIL